VFIPTTMEEVKKLNWESLDIILVSGDTYIDSSYIGVSVIGHVLMERGYRVGIIAQPDAADGKDIMRMGEPELFWGVTSGSVDSMVSNYTASRKKRNQDDLTPGGVNNRRPDRAVIAYCNLIRRHFKNTAPIVLGGIEASLRRIAHYDYWDNRIRRSILLDSKADFLVYGMGENSVVELADCLRSDKSFSEIKGICYISDEKPDGFTELPSFEDVIDDKELFSQMFKLFYRNRDPITAKGLVQKHGERFLIQNPPGYQLSSEELDKVYSLPFERDIHPFYKKEGEVRALETIKFSVTTHRGCYGECNFCAIALHQGTTVVSRSENSIIKEAEDLISNPGFKGYIFDVGGPTANMYGIECKKKIKSGACTNRRCIFPSVCKKMNQNHSRVANLLKRLRKLNGVKKVFVASGVRYDMVMQDEISGALYLDELITHHVSGQMKVAPEHSEDHILELMGKPKTKFLRRFREKFRSINKKIDKKQFLTYYFIAAHPGCTEKDMQNLSSFASEELKLLPEQIQIFTPTPSTYSTLMYYTEKNPFTGEDIFVEKEMGKKERQKRIMKERKKAQFSKNRNSQNSVKKSTFKKRDGKKRK